VANSKRVRIVLDTNVLISAALKPRGLEAAVVNAVLAGTVEAWATPEVWAEYEEVLARPKFSKVQSVSQTLLASLTTKVHRITATAIVTTALDEDDNRFLECAQAAKADYLITGNLKHYPAESGSTRMVNARGFFDAIGGADLPGEQADLLKEGEPGEAGFDLGSAADSSGE
jgi:putative PIN family toxin of toxin-antitoxin system